MFLGGKNFQLRIAGKHAAPSAGHPVHDLDDVLRAGAGRGADPLVRQRAHPVHPHRHPRAAGIVLLGDRAGHLRARHGGRRPDRDHFRVGLSRYKDSISAAMMVRHWRSGRGR